METTIVLPDLRRGDRVLPEAPRYDAGRVTPRAATGQVGYDDPTPLTIRLSPRKALVVATHCHAPHDHSPAERPEAADVLALDMAAHGLSLVTFTRDRATGEWRLRGPQKSPYNRRVHLGTTCKLTGPAVGDPRLRTLRDPAGRRVQGTLGSGPAVLTPWGTVLTAERGAARHLRGWAPVARRFDPTVEQHEANRFGWLVETHPFRPSGKPRKLTMLGRLDHRQVTPTLLPSGRLEISFRDEVDGTWFRYESRWRHDDTDGPLAGAHNRSLLEAGTLSARLDAATWVPLASERESYVAGMSVADVLIDTRMAVHRLAPYARPA